MENQNYENEAIKKESNSKLFIVIIALFIFVIMIIGVSMAAFTYTKESKNNYNTISTGNIYLNYTEDNNGISITNAFPVNDEMGKVLTDENYYFDFSLDASIIGNVVANYEISAEKVENSTLDNSEVKLYLEKMVDNKYEAVMMPKHFIPLEKNTKIGTMAGSMLLDSGSFEQSSNIKYRLRMWLDKNAVINDLKRTFGVRVSVKANIDLED